MPLVDAVVIGDDRAASDVDVLADEAIAKVGEVRAEGVLPEFDVLLLVEQTDDAKQLPINATGSRC